MKKLLNMGTITIILLATAAIAFVGCGSGFSEDSGKSDSRSVADDTAALRKNAAVDFLSGSDTDAAKVTRNLSLPLSGNNGTTITWAATWQYGGGDASSVVNADGIVTRPPCNWEDAFVEVTLTAAV
ncbi:MAG: hypothetical protein GY754_46700, partial [bacterium]|nr:hypothetical protein [bacterium]